FETTVERTAILDIMNRSGYTPSKSFVDKKVAELPFFQENGRFSVLKYNKMDASERIKLWQDMRNDLTVNIYHDDAGTIKIAEAEAEFIGRMALLQRKFRMAAFPYTLYPDSEVAAYASRNTDMFKTVYLSRITVPGGKREAQTILDKILSGEITFEDAARTQSGDEYADRGGDTGARMSFELSSEIPDAEQWQAVINLPKDNMSEALELSSGGVIFRANEMSRPPNLQDSETLGKVRGFLMSSERGVIEDWLITQAENFAQRARTVGFTGAAVEASLETHEFGPLPVNYGDSPLFTSLNSFQAPGLRDAVSDENFWRAAFSTPVGEPSRPVVLSGGGDNIVVLYPGEELPDESGAAENSKTTYSSWWAENETLRSIAGAILVSDKFNDNFINTYFRLFSN
ncbi:MAG: peptidylprolyl isomerase, partial [Spirochaetaceae bacterium]|nr:peptidylprolyl isomerase [Spirochaetaceae bacterium]